MKALKFSLCTITMSALIATSVGQAATTPATTITQIKVVETADAKHRLFHGAIWLDHDKAKYNYRWGGAHCGNHSLSELNISLLFAAFRAKYVVQIDYRNFSYRSNTYRCISGFSVTRT